MMQVAIIGAGNVGAALGKGLKKAGNAVVWGVRDPAKQAYEGLNVTEIARATAEADVVILATPWPAAEEAVKSAGNLAGKILIDATNPIAPDFSGLVDLGGSSAAEHIARWATGAKVVKAFNTIGSNIMEDPQFGQLRASLLIAGDDSEAKSVVSSLAKDLKFEPIDSGGLGMAKYLEALAWIWINQAVKQGFGREIVFQLIRR